MSKRYLNAFVENKHRTLITVEKQLKQTKGVVFCAVLMLLLCLIHGLNAGHYSNFTAFNGTFQNYNPIRRLLSGQVPYRDFQDYLGLGHLYLGSVVTFLLGGSYNDSLVAFSLLSILSFALILTVVGNAVLQKKEIALAMTNILMAIVLIESPIISVLSGTKAISTAVSSSLDTGNSARFLRGMILPISIILILLAMKFNGHCHETIKNRSVRWTLAMSVIAGFAFCWSNDYGISCWLCLVLLTFWIIICRERSFGKAFICTVVEIALSLVWTFIFVEILTLGHFPAWLQATFGTGGYQSWYYNSSKSFYLYDVDFSFEMLLQAFLCILYLWKVFKERGSSYSIKRYGMLAYANMCSFCAVNEYHILSGGDSREVALSVLFATIIFEILNYFRGLKICRGACMRKAMFAVSFTVGLALCGATLKDEIQFSLTDIDIDGVYVENLDGYLTTLGNDLLETDAFLDGATVFATYSSAQEVVSDFYQPSGTDYIIHVLGDDARDSYLDSFLNGEFDYVATIKKSYTGWEYWVERANWFFYRELYCNYHPIYSNSYEIYWEKNSYADENSQLGDFEVSIENVNSHTKKLIIQTNEEISGVADVYLDYSVQKNERKTSLLVIQTMLKIENTGETKDTTGHDWNYLRASSAEYIPITIVNGYGEVTLTSQPAANTYLEINSVSCARIFTVVSE